MAKKQVDWSGTAYRIPIGVAGGAATGGLLGAVIGGTAAAANATLDLVRQDRFGGTQLAEMQQDRLTEAMKQASDTIASLRMADHEPRQDWFAVEGDVVKASNSGVELLEGTLISAVNAFERRKVKLIANLWALLLFNPSVSSEAGIFLLKVANELSYRQLVVLAALTELSEGPPTPESAELDVALGTGEIVDRFRGEPSDHPFRGSATTANLVFDLLRRDVVRQGDGDQVAFNTRQVRPLQCAPTLIGRRLYALTVMQTHVPFEDRRGVADDLERPA
jgi:hypothetical protein